MRVCCRGVLSPGAKYHTQERPTLLAIDRRGESCRGRFTAFGCCSSRGTWCRSGSAGWVLRRRNAVGGHGGEGLYIFVVGTLLLLRYYRSPCRHGVTDYRPARERMIALIAARFAVIAAGVRASTVERSISAAVPSLSRPPPRRYNGCCRCLGL